MILTKRSIVLIALCAGSLAALLTYRFLVSERAQAARLSQPVLVVVTTRPIAARTVIQAADVRETTRKASSLPGNCATSVAEVVGQVAMTSLMANEPILRETLSRPTASLGLAYAVPDGMRAVAVALDPIIGVAGFLKPGDRVDVVATFTVEKLKVTKTVLQDVTLLAIGADIRPQEEQRSTSDRNVRPKEQPNATLAVTPTQAEKLILAEAGGKLRLTLRPADDKTHVELTGIRSDALIGVRSPAPVRSGSAPQRQSPPPPAAYMGSAPHPRVSPRVINNSPRTRDALSIDTIRGTQKTTIEVSED